MDIERFSIPSDEEAQAFTDALLAAEADYYENLVPETNFDDVTQSVEALANFLSAIAGCPLTFVQGIDCLSGGVEDCRVIDCWTEWLKREVDYGTTD